MDFTQEEQPDGRSWIGRILHDAGVREVIARMSGSGDSGDIDEIVYSDSDGNEMSSLEIDAILAEVHPPFASRQFGGKAEDGHDHLVTLVTEEACRHGNWYDNDGGHVESRYVVHRTGLETDYVSLTQNEPEEYDDEYDDEEDDWMPDNAGMQP